MKNAKKTVDIKPSYNINNQNKTIKTKRKEKVTLFGSVHDKASPLKINIGGIFVKLIIKHFALNHKIVK